MPAVADTRTKIVLAAERLFAERGIGSVSLRDIGAAAGQRNPSAIQYHFGAKPDLVTAVFQHRMSQVNERRLELLARMHSEGRAADPTSLVEALIHPLVAVVNEPGCHYAHFLAQLSAHPTYRISERWQIASSLHAVRDGLRRTLPSLPDEIYAERWRMVTHLLVHTIADHEDDPTSVPHASELPSWVTRLIKACVAVLNEPHESEEIKTCAAYTRDGEASLTPAGQVHDG